MSARHFKLIAWLLSLELFLATTDCLFAATLKIYFEELPLESADFYNGSDIAGGFTSFGVTFNNLYTEFGGGCCWNGWAYSQTTDTTTPGVVNQYSAIAGNGFGGSLKYGVAFSGFDAGGGIMPEITLPTTAEPISVKVTNTTYAALSMLHGDGFAKKFGGPSGNDPDWFLLKVEGRNAADVVVGDVPLHLADYTFADPNEDYILDQWTDLDLTPLAGLGVRKLAFRLSSTDNGTFGMNTPAYVAIDDLVLDVTSTPGDFDLSGMVDHQDLDIWNQHFGTSLDASLNMGDADEDGDVDGHDFLVWQRHVTVATPPSLIVPEPTTHTLIFGLLCIAHFIDQSIRIGLCRRVSTLKKKGRG